MIESHWSLCRKKKLDEYCTFLHAWFYALKSNCSIPELLCLVWLYMSYRFKCANFSNIHIMKHKLCGKWSKISVYLFAHSSTVLELHVWATPAMWFHYIQYRSGTTFQLFQNIPEYSRIFLKYFWVFLNIFEYFRIFCNILEYFGIL